MVGLVLGRLIVGGENALHVGDERVPLSTVIFYVCNAIGIINHGDDCALFQVAKKRRIRISSRSNCHFACGNLGLKRGENLEGKG